MTIWVTRCTRHLSCRPSAREPSSKTSGVSRDMRTRRGRSCRIGVGICPTTRRHRWCGIKRLERTERRRMGAALTACTAAYHPVRMLPRQWRRTRSRLSTAQRKTAMNEAVQRVDAVFEGGGVKGIALIGAAAVVEAAGYRFYNLAGTSAGAIVAALLGAGYTAA